MQTIVPIIFFGASFLLTLSVPNRNPEPFVFSQSCRTLDYNDLCIQKLIKVQNPRLKAVTVDMDCGPENNVAFITVPAGARVSFYMDVSVPIPTERNCKISDWMEP